MLRQGHWPSYRVLRLAAMNWREVIILVTLLALYMGASGSEPRPEPQDLRGTATWYCGNGSACTRGYGPSDLVAAIDPTTGIGKGETVTVWHGDRSVAVRIVDVCACAGRRVIDLTYGAFSRLADPSRGVIRVVLVPGRATPTRPATDSE